MVTRDRLHNNSVLGVYVMIELPNSRIMAGLYRYGSKFNNGKSVIYMPD